jgi:hypothetical protein
MVERKSVSFDQRRTDPVRLWSGCGQGRQGSESYIENPSTAAIGIDPRDDLVHNVVSYHHWQSGRTVLGGIGKISSFSFRALQKHEVGDRIVGKAL